MTGEVSKSLTATMDRPGPSGTQSRGVKRFLSERELEQVIDEIYDNEGSEVECSDSDVEQEEASVPIKMSSDSSDSDAELRTRVDQSSGYPPSRVRGRTRGRTVRGSRITGSQRPSDTEKDWKIEGIVHDIPFSSIPGISNASNINENLSPFQVFHIFVNNDISHIKTETNRYAAQQIAAQKRKGPISKNSVFSRWKPVTISEIERFLAIIVHMGFVRKPRLRDYWSTNPIYDSKFASSLQISRDRFFSMLTFLHLNNNDTYIPRGNPGHDPLYKLRPVFNKLMNDFHTFYIPDEELTVDEGICGFRGRVHFRVFIKGKPEKYGMKLFFLCEATSGYACMAEVYTGSTDKKDYNSAFNVVDRLVTPYYNKGHTIYMDRWFTSPKLFDHLWQNGTKAVGTVMPNRREMPKQAFQQKLKKGERVSR